MADGDRIPKVLVVDDEPNIRELVEVALKFHGCAVAVSATGKDALHQAETYEPDLMILDVMLPDMDGFEVCRMLRADGNEVPVIFLTARDTTSDTIRGLTLGGDDYVTKPFSVEALVARVRAVLRRTTRAAGSDGPGFSRSAAPVIVMAEPSSRTPGELWPGAGASPRWSNAWSRSGAKTTGWRENEGSKQASRNGFASRSIVSLSNRRPKKRPPRCRSG